MITKDNQIKELIRNYTSISMSNKDSYIIIMISNVQTITPKYKDYENDSIISEYYSEKQYNEILCTLRDIGFEVKCYFDENSFIKDYFKNALCQNSKIPIVLNSSQAGIGAGRKSLIPAFCELNSIIHTNSNSFLSSYTRQKYEWFCFLKEGDYQIIPSWRYDYHFGWYNGKPNYNQKVIVKLNRESSSIGLSKDNIFCYSDDCDSFLKELSIRYNQPLIIQNYISGYEVEVPCINSVSTACSFSPTGISINGTDYFNNDILDYNIRGQHLFDFYDFEAKDVFLAQQIRKTTENITSDLNLFGLTRVDYRIDYNGNYFITDISSNPHLTKSMTFYYLYKRLGFSYKDILLTLLGLTIERGYNE